MLKHHTWYKYQNIVELTTLDGKPALKIVHVIHNPDIPKESFRLKDILMLYKNDILRDLTEDEKIQYL